MADDDPAPAPEHPLDTPQVFRGTTSYMVREELQELVARDLLGPWDGATEQFAPRAQGPRERYLVGMVGPKHPPESVTKQADQVPDTELGAEGDGEAALPEVRRSSRITRSGTGCRFADATRMVLSAQEQAGLPDAEAAAYLRGVAAGYAQHSRVFVSTPIWTGRSTDPSVATAGCAGSRDSLQDGRPRPPSNT